jgi:hypothetical protein
MFQVLQACETGEGHEDVTQCNLLDKYQSFYATQCLHYQRRTFQRLTLILKLITLAIESCSISYTAVPADSFLHILPLPKSCQVMQICTQLHPLAQM